MASVPTFDPNHIQGTNNIEWHNPAVTDLYEPGSTLKTLTLSAVMDAEGLQHQYDKVVCTGTFQVGNHIIHCAKDPPLYGVHGVETMRDVLKNSCNIGAATYALRLGAPTLFKYEQRFGLLERPDSGLPDEQFCHLKGPDVKPWSKIELANIAFGQGISMTPLQLASIYATVANNGIRVHPRIILGQEYKGTPEQVIKPEVARTMLTMLQFVVTDGTGEPAQIAGFNVGGKTGSAQIAEHGHYGDQYVGSFCGIVPLSHPRLVILCAIFKPQGVHWGSVVAAPVVHNIAQLSMSYLKEPRDNPAMVDYADRQSRPAPVMPANGSKTRHAAAG
jgi:cell division protein FtsI/penicillin-binding protein 2